MNSNITVNITSENYLSQQGYGTQILSYQESVQEKPRKQVLGFCDSVKCGDELYKIGARKWYLVSSDKSQVECKTCGHVIFWSNKWRRDD